jgi:hypothetical protein
VQLPAAGPDGLADAIGEQLSIRQAGQRVLQRLTDQPPLVADDQEEEHAKRDPSHPGRRQAGQPQFVLALPQLGQPSCYLLLLAVGECADLVLQRGIGGTDRPFMDRLCQGRIADVHRGQHPLQVGEDVGVFGLDRTGGGGGGGFAVDDQEVQRGGKRVARFLEGEPQVTGGRGQVGVADGLFVGNLAAGLVPGIALGAEVFDLLDGLVDACRSPDGATGHTQQHGHQAGGRHADEHTAPGVHRPGSAACAIGPHYGVPPGSLPYCRFRAVTRPAVIQHIGTIGPPPARLTWSADATRPASASARMSWSWYWAGRPHSPRHSLLRRPSPAQPGGGRHTDAAR